MTWGIIMAAHLTAFLGVGLADLLPRPEQSRAIFSLLVLALVPPHVAVPGLEAIRIGLHLGAGGWLDKCLQADYDERDIRRRQSKQVFCNDLKGLGLGDPMPLSVPAWPSKREQ